VKRSPPETLWVRSKLLPFNEICSYTEVLNRLDGELDDTVVHPSLPLPYILIHRADLSQRGPYSVYGVIRMLLLNVYYILPTLKAFDTGRGRIADGAAQGIVDLQVVHIPKAFRERASRRMVTDPSFQPRLPEYRVRSTFEDG
jgi:hypothetical protein